MEEQLKKKKEKYYAIWIFSEGGGKIKKIRISERMAKFLKWTSLSIGGLFFFCLIIFIWGFPKIKEHGTLKKENYIYQNVLKNSLVQIDEIYKYISELKLLEKKIRLTADIEGGNITSSATGGNDEEIGDETPENKILLSSKLERELSILKSEIQNTKRNYEELLPAIEEKRDYMRSIPLLWPVRGWVTSEFGFRFSPMVETYRFHQGIDIATRPGTPIIAPADGRVVFAGWEGTYGKTILINHGYGIVTRYAHLSEMYVSEGQMVKRWEVIGTVGDTGITTGPHLHYEVIVNGVPVNPRDYLID
jgi:murein DD-endopeptidase MepM/ murein hydrolase activator NlpD